MNKFLDEILEQPNSLKETLEYYSSGEGIKTLESISSLYQKNKFEQIIFTGMGSSYFVSYAAACLFNSLGFDSYAVNTSELLYYNTSLINPATLLVCISQSGESIEMVKLLEILTPDIHCIGICNEAESSLSAKAAEILLSRAGKEEMTSTKTFTSITMLIYIWGLHLAGKWNTEQKQSVQRAICSFEKLLGSNDKLARELEEFFGDIEFMQFIGRGPSYSTACQSELMFKEAAKIASAGTLGGEFRHGPMEMVKPGFMSTLFAAEGKTYAQSIKMAADIVKYNGKVLLITNKDPQLSDPKIMTITIDEPDEYLFSIPNIIPIQLLVNSIALSKGLVPGDFINGGKVTLSE